MSLKCELALIICFLILFVSKGYLIMEIFLSAM